MFQEARAFLRQMGGIQGTVAGLLTAPVSDAAPALRACYESDTSGASAAPRIGLLSLGAVLAKTAKQYLTSPTLRGLFIRDQLLCQHIALPDRTSRRLRSKRPRRGWRRGRPVSFYDQHAKEPACASCHALVDPLGYALEGFDGAGRFRTARRKSSRKSKLQD